MPTWAWLPDGLLDEALTEAETFAVNDGGTWSITLTDAPAPRVRRFGQKAPEQLRTIVYTAADGSIYSGTYELGRRSIDAINIAADTVER